MKRRTITGGLGLMVFAGLPLVVGNRTGTTVWADASSVSWDVYMEDPEPTPPAREEGPGAAHIVALGQPHMSERLLWCQDPAIRSAVA